MPFPPARTAGAPSAPAAPAFGAAPPMGMPTPPVAAPPAARSMPTPPPAPAAPATGPNLWVVHNGAAVPMTHAQYASLPPTTPAMAENQLGGWKTLADFMPVAAAPAPTTPLGRAAFAPAPGQVPAQPQQYAQPVGGAAAGAFSGIEGAQITRRGDFIKDGNYVLRLGSAQMKNLRSGKMSLLLETIVVTSSYDPNDAKTQDCHKEGEAVTIFINKNDSFNGNVKELIIALCGIDAHGNPRPDTDTVRQEEANAMVGPAQPFAGVLFYIEARTRPMKTDPTKSFTNINYWPMPLLADGSPDFDKFMRDIR